MGLFKILKNNFYLSYYGTGNELTIHIFNLEESCFYLKINPENVSIKKWAQNLKQATETYLSQLSFALQEQTNADKSDNTSNIADEGQSDNTRSSSSKQNIFELDEESNLIWRQFFPSKNIFGRKGKFSLEKKARSEILPLIMDGIMMELHEREAKVVQLYQETTKLNKEKEELRKIAEKSVAAKEIFEAEIYGKFATLLNAKKKKCTQLARQLAENDKRGCISVPASGDGTREEGEGNVGEGYDEDTDVDSPLEEEEGERGSPPSLLKRKGPSLQWGSKRSRARGEARESEEEDCDDVEAPKEGSQDLLNESLEADLRVGFARRKI